MNDKQKYCCPYCKKWLLSYVQGESQAKGLEIYCKGCKRQIQVNIEPQEPLSR